MAKLNLSWKTYNLELKHPFTISNYSRTHTPVILTELEYDGIVGYGEASLPQYLGETQDSVIYFLKRANLSQFKDPMDIENILDYVDNIMPKNTAAKASIDIALHDLVGKILQKPLYKIWELDRAETPNSTYTIGMDSDEVIREKTREVASDFKVLKVKLGGNDDKSIINVIRSITNLPLAIDANQGWKDRNEALEKIIWLKENGAIMVEQPMDKFDLDNNAWLTANSPIPIYADESIQRLQDMENIKGAFSGINIKLMKCTGMNEAWKMIRLAPSLGFEVMIGCMTETSCGISAAAQLSPAVSFADLDGALLIKNDCFEGVKLTKGKVILNDLPGIGIKKINYH